MEEDITKLYYKYKFIILGDVSVGKTCIASKFINNQFNEKYVCTIGIEFKVKTLLLNKSTIVDIQLWDTCGQEKFRTLTRQYYRDANGIILVFDLNSQKSFNEIETWLEEIKTNFPTKGELNIIIVGNKSDLVTSRKVNDVEIMKFIKKHKLEYLEVSAKDGKNISQTFEKLCWMVIHNDEDKHKKTNNVSASYELPKHTQSIKYYLPKKEEKKKGCC